MAIVETEETKTYRIVLDSSEAIWLKGYLQNDISGRENAYDKEKRGEIWHALNSAGVGIGGE